MLVSMSMIFSALSDPASVLGWWLVVFLLVAIVPQGILTAWFVQLMRSKSQAYAARVGIREQSAGVPAEVVLCLRGCDPTLKQVFESLARQRYNHWRLRVVVDSKTDPAWPVATATVAQLTKDQRPSWREVTIEPLAQRPTEGSLKCASLRQVLQTLDPQTQVVALIDADCIVSDQWLLSLVDECLQPGVGAVSGNRWYEPVGNSLTGTVRAIWNAGAIVQMTAFGIPWGGSLAVRRDALEACRWVDVLRTTLCEDTSLISPLTQAGWRYCFVPPLLAIDEDDAILIAPLTRWISRQLLTARLHHPLWPLVAAHGLFTSAVLAAAVIFCAVAIVFSNWPGLALVASSLVAYEAISVLLVLVIKQSAARAVAVVQTNLRPLSSGQVFRWILLLPLTQIVYAVAIVSSLQARSIEWRGITYRITRFSGRLGVSSNASPAASLEQAVAQVHG